MIIVTEETTGVIDLHCYCQDAPTGAAVDAIVSLLEMYNTQAERLDNLLADLEAEMKVMRDEIESLSRNLRELNHPPSKQERCVNFVLLY